MESNNKYLSHKKNLRVVICKPKRKQKISKQITRKYVVQVRNYDSNFVKMILNMTMKVYWYFKRKS